MNVQDKIQLSMTHDAPILVSPQMGKEFFVAGAVARGLCVKAIFLFGLSFFVLVGVGWGNNVHVRLLSDVMLLR